MAAFTSIGSGNWNDETGSVWNTGGTYPGKDSATDTATIANGHTIVMNILAFPSGGMGAVTVQSGGILQQDSSMNDIAAGFEGTVTVNSGGTLAFTSDNAEMMLAANLVINGTLTINSTAGAGTYRIRFSSNSYSLQVGGTGIITARGRTKTQKTQLNGAVSAGVNQATMDDVTGWANSDLVVLCTGVNNDWDAIEVMTIQSIAGNQVTFTGNTTYVHADNSRVYNLTCSTIIQRDDTTQQFPATLVLSDGATVDIDYVMLNCCGVQIKMNGTAGGGAGAIKNLVVYASHASSTARLSFFGTSNSLQLENCISHGLQYAPYPDTGGLVDNITFLNCVFSYVADLSIAASAAQSFTALVFDGCEFTSCRTTSFGWAGSIYYRTPAHYKNGYAWANAVAFYARTPDMLRFTNWTFGKDPGGNIIGQSNSGPGAELALPTSDIMTPREIICDRCVFATTDDTAIISNRGSMRRDARFRSYNHRQVAGRYMEGQVGGYIVSDYAQQRSGTACFKVDAKHTSYNAKFYVVFTVADGDTVTFKYYAKKSGGVDGVTWNFGHHGGGLGGFASGQSPSLTTSYVQYTVTFNLQAQVTGDVELVLDVDPTDGTDDFVYLDDFSVELT